MTDLPTTASEITADWMTTVLRAGGTIPAQASVESVGVDPGAAGVGFMGEVARVELAYQGAVGEAPQSVVVKFPTRSPEIRAMMHPTRIYEREHRFYAELADETPLRTPVVHHITCEPSDDPSQERYLLVLEDLSHLTLGDQVAGLTLDQASAALIGLGAHHARFWGGAGLDGIDVLPMVNGPLNQAGSAIYEASLPGFLDVFGEVIDAELDGFVGSYAAARPGIIDDLAAMPQTLIHFDYRADNLFFDDSAGGGSGGAGGGSGGEIAVIDWQAISRGGGAADVGYLLSQNLSVEDRRANEQELLKVYHEALVAGGVTDYSFETLRADYRVGVACGWIIPVLAVGSLDVSSERAMALWTEVLARTQAALLDHEIGAKG